MFNEYKIYTIDEYIKTIHNISKPFHGKLPIGYALLYRGISDSQYELLPTIARNKKSKCEVSILDYERNLIEMAKHQLPEVFDPNLSPLNLLSLLQHYGIPTRLLDVTSNPLTALYFACNQNEKNDGEVIVFRRYIEDIASYAIHNAIADSYRFVSKGDITLEHFYNHFKKQAYSLEQIGDFELLFDHKMDVSKWIKDCCSKPMFVKAPIHIVRQQRQQGEYILFPNRIENLKNLDNRLGFVNIIDAIPKTKEYIYERIVIDKSCKQELLASLNMLGINKGYLFGDSVDEVCKQIVADVKRMIL